jgi:hypothetical protein
MTLGQTDRRLSYVNLGDQKLAPADMNVHEVDGESVVAGIGLDF